MEVEIPTLPWTPTTPSLSNDCESVLPCPVKVEVEDIVSQGKLSRIFRNANMDHKIPHADLKNCIIIPTKDSHCKMISREKFHEAVYHTMRIINPKEFCITIKAKIVIDHIYDAACKLGSTIDELICFTAVAMHNMYAFAKFTTPNELDLAIGVTCRGLLQFKGLVDYEKLCSISKTNYIARPYLLDYFSEQSIHDEFHAYKIFYYGNAHYNRLDSFIRSIHRLASDESCMITLEVALEIRAGRYVPRNILEEKILRRFRIYYILCAFIFCGEENPHPWVRN